MDNTGNNRTAGKRKEISIGEIAGDLWKKYVKVIVSYVMEENFAHMDVMIMDAQKNAGWKNNTHMKIKILPLFFAMKIACVLK